MNRHNIVEMHNYKQNKNQTRMEFGCFEILDKAVERVNEMNVYVKNFHWYIENMVRHNHLNEEFARNLKGQIDLIVETAAKSIKERKE